MITYLGLLIVLLFLGFAAYGFGIIARRPPTSEELSTERCTLCRKQFTKTDLVERAVGDSKVFYFCESCIRSLQSEISSRFVGSTKA